MASLQHVLVRATVLATVLATLAACVLAGGSGGSGGSGGHGGHGGPGGSGGGSSGGSSVAAFVNAIGGDAITAKSTYVCIQFYQQFGETSELTTVPPVDNTTLFGQIDVFQAPVTETADPNSRRIGTANGNLFYDDLSREAYENLWTLTFNSDSGFPPNSSINFEGYQPSTSVFPGPYNYSVVGGTGAFACARGVVEESVVFQSATLETDGDVACMVVGCGFNPNTATYLFSATP